MPDESKNSVKAPELRKIAPGKIATYQYGTDPIIIHFIRMGWTEPVYHVCREDAYGMYPYRFGDGTEITMRDCVMSKEEVKNRFGITLDI